MIQNAPTVQHSGPDLPLPEAHYRKLGIGSRTTFFRWEKLGLAVLKVGGRRFIRLSELNRFMEAEGMKSAGGAQ